MIVHYRFPFAFAALAVLAACDVNEASGMNNFNAFMTGMNAAVSVVSAGASYNNVYDTPTRPNPATVSGGGVSSYGLGLNENCRSFGGREAC